jgi:hypothetical protein
VDGLQDHGYHVVLANPAGMQPYSGMKYTDDVSDAYFLAELLRLNLLPTGHIHDRKTRPVRDLLRRPFMAARADVPPHRRQPISPPCHLKLVIAVWACHTEGGLALNLLWVSPHRIG